MAHIILRVSLKRTHSIPHIFMQSSRFRFGSSVVNKAIYTKSEAVGWQRCRFRRGLIRNHQRPLGWLLHGNLASCLDTSARIASRLIGCQRHQRAVLLGADSGQSHRGRLYNREPHGCKNSYQKFLKNYDQLTENNFYSTIKSLAIA